MSIFFTATLLIVLRVIIHNSTCTMIILVLLLQLLKLLLLLLKNNYSTFTVKSSMEYNNIPTGFNVTVLIGLQINNLASLPIINVVHSSLDFWAQSILCSMGLKITVYAAAASKQKRLAARPTALLALKSTNVQRQMRCNKSNTDRWE